MTSLQTSKEHPKMKKQKNKTFMLGSEVCTQGSVGSDRPPLPSHQTSQLSTPESQRNKKKQFDLTSDLLGASQNEKTKNKTFMLGSEVCTQGYVGSDRPPLPSHQTSQLSTLESQKNQKKTL
jgi:hypothetical protein